MSMDVSALKESIGNADSSESAQRGMVDNSLEGVALPGDAKHGFEPPKSPAPAKIPGAFWWAVGALALAFAASYIHLFNYFWQAWTQEHGPFGYGYFVPPCVAYLLWANRKDIKAAPLTPAKKRGWGILVAL